MHSEAISGAATPWLAGFAGHLRLLRGPGAANERQPDCKRQLTLPFATLTPREVQAEAEPFFPLRCLVCEREAQVFRIVNQITKQSVVVLRDPLRPSPYVVLQKPARGGDLSKRATLSLPLF